MFFGISSKRFLCCFQICLLCCVLSTIESGAQDLNELIKEKQSKVVFLGLDFTQARFVGRSYFISQPSLKAGLVNALNDLLGTERKKYDLAGSLNIPENKYFLNTDFFIKLNDGILPENRISDADTVLSPQNLMEAVSNYKLDISAGIGISFIVEGFNRNTQLGSIWVTFIDLSSKQIILAENIKGLAGGSGLRNYWAHAVFMVIQDAETAIYKRAKKGPFLGESEAHWRENYKHYIPPGPPPVHLVQSENNRPDKTARTQADTLTVKAVPKKDSVIPAPAPLPSKTDFAVYSGDYDWELISSNDPKATVDKHPGQRQPVRGGYIEYYPLKLLINGTAVTYKSFTFTALKGASYKNVLNMSGEITGTVAILSGQAEYREQTGVNIGPHPSPTTATIDFSDPQSIILTVTSYCPTCGLNGVGTTYTAKSRLIKMLGK